jgi:predicted nucleic acid-binding protein
MATQILIDSGFLYALLDRHNPEYTLARTTYRKTPARYLVPHVVLTEAAFLFRRTHGVPGVIRFLDAVLELGVTFEPLLAKDLSRARDIMAEYADSKLDLVDCFIMAMAERLNITKICTLDRRDFAMFRPRHCEHFELLP